MLIKSDCSNKLCNINLYKDYLDKTLFPFARKRTFYTTIVIIAQVFLMTFITLYVNVVKKDSNRTLVVARKHGISVHIPTNIKEIREVAISVKKMKLQRAKLLSVVGEVFKDIPNDVWLNSLQANINGTISVRGNSFTASSIAIYMSRLSKNDAIKSVLFGNDGLKKNKDGTYSFSFLITTVWHKEKKKKRI